MLKMKAPYDVEYNNYTPHVGYNYLTLVFNYYLTLTHCYCMMMATYRKVGGKS